MVTYAVASVPSYISILTLQWRLNSFKLSLVFVSTLHSLFTRRQQRLMAPVLGNSPALHHCSSHWAHRKRDRLVPNTPCCRECATKRLQIRCSTTGKVALLTAHWRRLTGSFVMSFLCNYLTYPTMLLWLITVHEPLKKTSTSETMWWFSGIYNWAETGRKLTLPQLRL